MMAAQLLATLLSPTSIIPSALFVSGLGDKTSDLPLYEDTPTHCDKMVDFVSAEHV